MSAANPREFYTERIPAQFNRALEEQAALGEAGRRVLDGLRAVNATLQVEVAGEHFFLNIAAGLMSAGDSPAHEPFLSLRQDRAAFDRLSTEAGDSAMALLGGLSGLAGEMKLTKARIELLAGVKGLLRFQVSGNRGFTLDTHFGPGPIPDAPQASIAVDESAYRELRAGTLDPSRPSSTARSGSRATCSSPCSWPWRRSLRTDPSPAPRP